MAYDGHPLTKVCPECGMDLEGIDPAKHSLLHWPERMPATATNLEARRRQATLIGKPEPQE